MLHLVSQCAGYARTSQREESALSTDNCPSRDLSAKTASDELVWTYERNENLRISTTDFDIFNVFQYFNPVSNTTLLPLLRYLKKQIPPPPFDFLLYKMLWINSLPGDVGKTEGMYDLL